MLPGYGKNTPHNLEKVFLQQFKFENFSSPQRALMQQQQKPQLCTSIKSTRSGKISRKNLPANWNKACSTLSPRRAFTTLCLLRVKENIFIGCGTVGR